MMAGLKFPLVAVFVLVMMTSPCTSAMEVIDLTYELSKESIHWPIYPPFSLTVLHRKKHNDGYWLEYNMFSMAEHTGTHMNAPSHFAHGRWRVHDVPVSRLVGPGVVVDVTEQANNDPDYLVTVDDLKAWEEEHGEIPQNAIVVMSSGWGRRYPDRKQVFNTDRPSDTTTFHFPGFHEDAAVWLVEERNVSAVGGDTPTPDAGQAHTFPVHRTLSANNILILANVANVERLPPSGSTIFIGAVNLRDGSGAPARVVAVIDDRGRACAASGTGSVHFRSVSVVTGLLTLLASLLWTFTH